MVIVRFKRCFLSLITASACVVLLYICYPTNLSQISAVTMLKTTPRQHHERPLSEWKQNSWLPTVVQPGLFQFRNETFNCTTAVLMNMTFPVCHYTAETDLLVTGSLLSGTYYEAGDISRALRLLRSHRHLQLVDIGANIGLWSLPAARMTQVLAVEPNWRSMSRLAKSVDLGAVGSNITLVHNAVSDVRATFYVGVTPRNKGIAFLVDSTQCKTVRYCNTDSPITTIFLNDLVPLMRSNSALLKVDVEGHEFNIFTNSSAKKFFDLIDVPYVSMEWAWIKLRPVRMVQRLLDFFYSRNYTVFSMEMSQLKEHYLKWPQNILLKKRPYVYF